MITMNGICKVVIVDDDRTAIENLCRELALYPEMDVRGTAVIREIFHRLSHPFFDFPENILAVLRHIPQSPS